MTSLIRRLRYEMIVDSPTHPSLLGLHRWAAWIFLARRPA
jgi:hypothetical protein